MRYRHIEVTLEDEPDASLNLGHIRAFVKLADKAKVPDNYAVIVDGDGPTEIEVSEPLH